MKSLAELCREVLTTDPARVAIEYVNHAYTWADVRQVASETQAALDISGAGAWGAVSFVARNRPSALAALAAMLADGRTVRMIHPLQSPGALAAAVAGLDLPVLVMAEEDFTPEISAVLAAKRMAGIGLSEMGARFMPGHTRAQLRDAPRDGPPIAAVEILSSATTDAAKQFAIPHEVFARFVQGQDKTALDDPIHPPTLFTFPISSISGMYMACASFLRGERIELLDQFALLAWLNYLRRYRPTTADVPPVAVAIILDAGVPQDELSSLKAISTGAAPLDSTLQGQFEEKYGIKVLLSYDASELDGPPQNAAFESGMDAPTEDKAPTGLTAVAGSPLAVRRKPKG